VRASRSSEDCCNFDDSLCGFNSRWCRVSSFMASAYDFLDPFLRSLISGDSVIGFISARLTMALNTQCSNYLHNVVHSHAMFWLLRPLRRDSSNLPCSSSSTAHFICYLSLWYLKPISQLLFDYDTTISRCIRLRQKWSKLRFCVRFDCDTTTTQLRQKLDMFIFACVESHQTEAGAHDTL